MSSQVLSLDQAAARAGIVRRTLDRLRSVGEGPAEVQVSARRVGILETDFEAWIAARRRPAPGKAA
jgi:predicted DNA-binding transcriptional regulator AlpA